MNNRLLRNCTLNLTTVGTLYTHPSSTLTCWLDNRFTISHAISTGYYFPKNTIKMQSTESHQFLVSPSIVFGFTQCMISLCRNFL